MTDRHQVIPVVKRFPSRPVFRGCAGSQFSNNGT